MNDYSITCTQVISTESLALKTPITNPILIFTWDIYSFTFKSLELKFYLSLFSLWSTVIFYFLFEQNEMISLKSHYCSECTCTYTNDTHLTQQKGKKKKLFLGSATTDSSSSFFRFLCIHWDFGCYFPFFPIRAYSVFYFIWIFIHKTLSTDCTHIHSLTVYSLSSKIVWNFVCSQCFNSTLNHWSSVRFSSM